MNYIKGIVGGFRDMEMNEPPKARTQTSRSQPPHPLPPNIPTSAHTLLSSLHGRNRRQTRNIGKRDLQAAVKYGEKEATYPNPKTGEKRWKYTYKNIVYITEGNRCIKEVTSYVQPLKIPEAIVTPADFEVHNRISEKFKKQPSLVTSHTIFIVDQSASMKTSDVEQFRNRSDAVFGTLALEFVGKQIEDKAVHHTDCASLVLMRDTSEVVIFREPMDNVFYNKLLQQQKEKPYSHGNYIPALKVAEQLAKIEVQNPNCAVLLLFLSDGRPSDYNPDNEREKQSFFDRIRSIISKISKPLLGRLVFGAIGFADNEEQFEVLQHMANCFIKCNTMGSFQHAKGNFHTLGAAVSTLSCSLLQTKATVSNLAGRSSRTPRNLQRESPEKFDTSSAYPDKNWIVYQQQSSQQLKRWVWSEKESTFVEVKLDQGNLNVKAVAIKKNHFGDGAERVVYSLRELVQSRGKFTFVGQKLVAKECKYVEDERLKLKFHETFCKTQMQAEKIAKEFNRRITTLKKLHPYLQMANITFLDCWVYTMMESEDFERGVLCEKYLDHTKYKKWNSNNGYVAALPTIKGEDQIHVPLDVILEESSEDEEESSSSDDDVINTKKYRITTDDYPQAFSHFSYRNTRRKMIVCDLQGVFDPSAKPPLFEMTDPVIHYASSRDGKKRHLRFGRTDLGDRGINEFFTTHKCNDLCRLLGLEGDSPSK